MRRAGPEDAAAMQVATLTGADFRLNHVEQPFRLDLADMKPVVDIVRCPGPEEARLLRSWFASYMQETGPGRRVTAALLAEPVVP